MLALAGALVSGKLRLPRIRLLILIGMILLAVQHGRHQILVGVCAPLLLAPYLAQTWPTRASKTNPLFAFAAIAGLLLALIVRLVAPAPRGEDAISPVAALAHVPLAQRTAPVLNDYAFGGYLIWEGVRPFIDSRADLYGDRFLADYAALPDRSVLSNTLAVHHVQWTIFATDAPVIKLLETMPGWHRLYGDKIAVVDVKG